MTTIRIVLLAVLCSISNYAIPQETPKPAPTLPTVVEAKPLSAEVEQTLGYKATSAEVTKSGEGVIVYAKDLNPTPIPTIKVTVQNPIAPWVQVFYDKTTPPEVVYGTDGIFVFTGKPGQLIDIQVPNNLPAPPKWLTVLVEGEKEDPPPPPPEDNELEKLVKENMPDDDDTRKALVESYKKAIKEIEESDSIDLPDVKRIVVDARMRALRSLPSLTVNWNPFLSLIGDELGKAEDTKSYLTSLRVVVKTMKEE